MDAYTCGTCGKKVERDLVVFMKHTEAHIIAEIQKAHPEWAAKDGICPPCLDYFKKALGKR